MTANRDLWDSLHRALRVSMQDGAEVDYVARGLLCLDEAPLD